MESIKECKRCKLPKALDKFGLHSGFKDGHHNICKECKASEGRVFYSKNSETILDRSRLSAKAGWKKKRLKQYNLTEKEYKDLSDKQNGCCAICGMKPKDKICLYIDHDHETGVVRGLLCSHCNFMLGHAKDSIDILKSGIEYLGGC